MRVKASIYLFLALPMSTILVFFSCMMPGVNTAYADGWVRDGVPVCIASSGQWSQQIIPDSAGGAIITWSDNRSGNSDIYAQRIDSSGSVLWKASGVPICTAADNQSDAEIASDGDGGAIITWSDRRSGDLENPDIYAQRVDPNGVCMWKNNGAPVCTDADSQGGKKIVPDGSGGAIIVWLDGRLESGYDSDIFAQRIDHDGNPAWALDGIPVCTSTRDQGNLGIATNGAGGAIITWMDDRAFQQDIYAQHLDGDGLPQWDVDGIGICTCDEDQYFPVIVSDGSGGAIIAWADIRDGAGLNIFAQRVDPDGTALWTIDGVPVYTYNRLWQDLEITSDTAGGAVLAWRDQRSSENRDDIYAQRINPSGDILWAAGGAPVCTAYSDQFDPQLICNESGEAIITWVDKRNSEYDPDIYAQRFNTCGDPLWGEDGVAICKAEEVQENPRVALSGAGGALVTWQDERRGETDIYCQSTDYLPPLPDMKKWYLAEGCTDGGFETWVLVQNPNEDPVDIDMVFQTDSGEVQGPQNTIPPNSRRSYNVGEYVSSYNVSTQVTASGDIICERAMYGNKRSWGHDSIGVNATSDTWYLAEGCTDGGFETWVLVQNPNEDPVDIDMVFQTDSGEVQGPQNTIPPNSRRSYNVGEYVITYDVSTRVTASGKGVVCERAMYGGNRIWAHDSIGVSQAAGAWSMAEGCTEAGFETWILVQNPGDTNVEIDMYFMTDTEVVPGPLETIPPHSRRSYNAGEYVSSYNVSTVVYADGGDVICERAMYGNNRTWGHDSIGVCYSSNLWCMAEGCTAGGFETWALVQNVGDQPTDIAMIFMTDQGPVNGPQETIPAFTRKSYNVGEYVSSYDVSILVMDSTSSIICERAMYGNSRTWGHDSIGYAPAVVASTVSAGSLKTAGTREGEH